MLFTSSCQCKNLWILAPRYFTEFDGYSLSSLNLVLVSSESTSIRDFKVTSSVFSALSVMLFALNQSFKCLISQLSSLSRFLLAYLYKKDLYHQQCYALCSIELPYEDHWYKLRKEVVLEQNLMVHHNLLALS